MRALLSPIQNLFKKEKEEEKVKVEAPKEPQVSYSNNTDLFAALRGPRVAVTQKLDPTDFEEDSRNDERYIRFGLDSEIDHRRMNLDNTHKISKIYEYPDFDVKQAQLPQNFIYIEHDLRQNSVSHSSVASSFLRPSQLHNILPPGMNPDNSNINKSLGPLNLDLSVQNMPQNLEFELGYNENFMKMEQLSGIMGEDEMGHMNNILITESEDNHQLIKLVSKLKECTKENQIIADITPKNHYNFHQSFEPKVILGQRDFNKNYTPNGNPTQPVLIQNIDSQVDENSQDSFENFESFPPSQQYIGLFVDQDKSKMKVVKKPLGEIILDDFNKHTSNQNTERSQSVLCKSNVNQTNSQNSKVVMKFKMNPSSLQSMLKPAKTQTTNDKTITKSKLDDTVPEEFTETQERIETVNPKLYIEQNRFLRNSSGKKGISMATEVFSTNKPQKLNRRTNTEFVFEKNLLYPSTVQSTPRNMMDSIKTNSMHENMEKKTSDFLDSVPSEMVESNQKIENTLQSLVMNINKLTEWAELQHIENSDLLTNYLEYSIQKTKDLISNNTELAKLTIDLANLKNIRDFLQPFNNIPKVNLIIANLQTISFQSLEKEDILKLKRKDIKTARLHFNNSSPSKSPRYPLSNQVANNLIRDYSSNPHYLIPEKNESVYTATHHQEGIMETPQKSQERLEVDYPESPETLKNRFFTIALDIKTKLPQEHPGRMKMIGGMFDDAYSKKIPQSEWREYLLNEITNC